MSASVQPYYAVPSFDGIIAKVGAENVRHSLGTYCHKELPLLGAKLKTPSGKTGVVFRAYNDPPSVKD